MDPWAALKPGIEGDLDARLAYNRWIRTGGFAAVVKVRRYTKTWFQGITRIDVDRIGDHRVYGTDHNNSGVRVSVPFAALEVD